jgi:hypothetical protein
MKKATEEQITKWKYQHGDVHEVVIDDCICYLKKPDRKTLSLATTLGQHDPMKFNEVILENCWIDGDDKIKTDNEYFFAAVEKLTELIQVKEATLKKL